MDVTTAPESALQRAALVGRRGLAGLVGGRGSSPSAKTQPDGAGLVGGRGVSPSAETQPDGAGLAGGRGSSPSAKTQPDGAGPVGRRGLVGLASRRGLLGRRAACCRFPAHPRTPERTPRAERSDRTSHPQLLPGAGATASASSQVRTAQQNSNPSQGQRLPNPAAIIIGGRQA